MTEQLQLRRGTGAQVAAFTGAQGEVVVDTTNNRAIVNDGATVGGWPAAKLAEVITNTRTAVSDAAYSALATDRSIAYTALTAARVVTLPASSAYPTGTTLTIFDESGAASATNTITLSAAGSDKIDGSASAVIASAYGFLAVQSNAAGKWTIVDSAVVTPASATAGHVAVFGASPNSFVDSGATLRQRLNASATYYVRAVVGTLTISNASPAVASLTAHGLQANDPIVFSVLPFRAAVTMTQANPAVVTWTNHGFLAGQPVVFSSTGSLPFGVAPGTTYYVISTGLSTNSFEFSATVGGAAVSTAAPTLTFTSGSSSIGLTNASTYLVVGQQVQFANSGGALPTNFAAAITYYVLLASSTAITVAATNGGTAISAGSAGTGTQSLSQVGTHYGSATGSLPTGVTAGTVYYVLSTGLTANSFEFSTSAGGAAVNTSSAQAGTVSLATGNDANNGSAQNRAGAFLTLQAAWNAVCALDLATNTATIQLADSAYTAGLSTNLSPFGGPVIIQGDASFPDNALLALTGASAFVFSASLGVAVSIKNLRVQTASGFANGVNLGAPGVLTLSGIVFGSCSGYHIYGSAPGATISLASQSNTIVGGAAAFGVVSDISQLWMDAASLTLLGTPAFSLFVEAVRLGDVLSRSTTFNGSATGQRYDALMNGIIETSGGGANYFPGNSAGATATGGQYE
jgi:Major tropism determinant N-terminal domain